jgi:hypothetical protein
MGERWRRRCDSGRASLSCSKASGLHGFELGVREGGVAVPGQNPFTKSFLPSSDRAAFSIQSEWRRRAFLGAPTVAHAADERTHFFEGLTPNRI